MKKILSVLIMIIALLAANTVVSYAEPKAEPKRVQFQKGRTTAVIKGVIERAQVVHEYALRAKSGQTMLVHLTPKKVKGGYTSIEIFDPSGIMVNEGGNSNDWEGALSATGDYQIHVSSPSGNTAYTLEITIR